MKALKRLFRALRLLRDLPRLRRSPLFDPAWYARSYADIGASDPARHYAAFGATEGRDPGPGFSTSGYALQGSYSGNPLLHYQARGRAAGRAALPVFPGRAHSAPEAPVVLIFGHQALREQFGAERSLLDMLDRALSAGMAPEVVLPQLFDPGYLAALQQRARRIHLIPYSWRRGDLPPDPALIARLTALIRHSGAVALHQNTLTLDAPLQAARAAGIPGVLWLREIPDQDPALCARLGLSAAELRARLLAEADYIIANSAATAAWIDPEAQLGERLLQVPNRIDPALSALPFTPAAPPRIGLIGSLVEKKGIADLVAAARIFHARGGRGDFLLIGPDSADLQALQPLPRGVRHAGYAATPAAAIAQIDLLLSLSHCAESFGRTVAEAMAAGRPVLAYDRGAPPGLIADAGRVVAADQPAAVAEALLELLAAPEGLGPLSERARARARALALAADLAPEQIFPHPAHNRPARQAR